MVASSEEVKATESKRKEVIRQGRKSYFCVPPTALLTHTYKGLHTRGREGLHLTPTFMYCSQILYLWVGSLMPPGGGQKETLFFCSIYSLLLKLKWTISWRKRLTSPDFLAHASNWVSTKYIVSFKLPQRRGGNKTKQRANLFKNSFLLFYYKIETWH